jgi:hypothetical protein
MSHAKKKLCLSQGDWVACSNHHGGICCFKSVVLGTFAVLSTIAAVGLVRSAAVAKVATIAILAPSPVASGICGVLVPAPCSDLDGGSQLNFVVNQLGLTAGQHVCLELRVAFVLPKVADRVGHITAELNGTALKAANWVVICAMMGAIITVLHLSLNLDFGFNNQLGLTAGQHVCLELRVAFVLPKVADRVGHIAAELNDTALKAANWVVICTMVRAIVTVLHLSLKLHSS